MDTHGPAEILGNNGYEFSSPGIAPPAAGCALVAGSGSGTQYQLGWTLRPVLMEPAVGPLNSNQYLAADKTWKSIPTVDSGSVVGALGYTPANDAQVVKLTGNQAIGGVKAFADPIEFPNSGTHLAPNISFTGLPAGNSTGIYRSSYQLGIAIQGAPLVAIGNGGVRTYGYFGFSATNYDAFGTVDTKLQRVSAGTVGVYQADGTTLGAMQVGELKGNATGPGNNYCAIKVPATFSGSVLFGTGSSNITGISLQDTRAVLMGIGGFGMLGVRDHAYVRNRLVFTPNMVHDVTSRANAPSLDRVDDNTLAVYQANGTTLGTIQASTLNLGGGTATLNFTGSAISSPNFALNGRGLNSWSGQPIGIASGFGVADVTLNRNATGPTWESRSAGGFAVRNADGSADAPITASTGTFSGNIGSGVTPSYPFHTNRIANTVMFGAVPSTWADNDTAFYCASGTARTGTFNVLSGSINASANVASTIRNTGSGTVQSTLWAVNNDVLSYYLTNGQEWITGIDASDSSSYKISPNGQFHVGTPAIRISTAGVVALNNRLDIGGVELGAERLNVFGPGSSPLVTVQTQNTTSARGFSFAGAVMSGDYSPLSGQISCAGELSVNLQQNGNGHIVYDAFTLGTGDMFNRYQINGGQSWSAGLDNSDSDAYVISAWAGLGTNNALRLGTDLSATFGGEIVATANATTQAGITIRARATDDAGYLVFTNNAGNSQRGAITASATTMQFSAPQYQFYNQAFTVEQLKLTETLATFPGGITASGNYTSTGNITASGNLTFGGSVYVGANRVLAMGGGYNYYDNSYHAIRTLNGSGNIALLSVSDSVFQTTLGQGYNSITPSARSVMTAAGARKSEVGDGAGAWSTVYREEYNAGVMRFGWGAALTPLQTIAAAASDAATTQTLANSIRTILLNLGLAI